MLLAPLLLVSALQAADAPLAVVTDLDLSRLAGRWYEIASIPTFFTRGCTAGFSEYTPVDAATFGVVTTCRKGTPAGEEVTSDGTLRVAGGGDPAKLEIQYVPFIWGDYWVIEKPADYSYLVVGHPSRDYLWVYAREPSMPEVLVLGIMGRLEAVGYELDEIVLTER
jgi:apolipoprotein D and lipocalin family protein